MPRKLFYVIAALTLVGSTFFGSGLENLFGPRTAIAQQARPQDVWRQVYQMLPDLPLENQYINRETGKPATENTLVSRLIRYHVYVKGRPPNYRLDWKMTIADYLGENDLMSEGAYPGYDTLRRNPLEGDRSAMGRMNRSQRDALVNSLVTVFNPKATAEPRPASTSQPETPTLNNSPPRLPQPGDARLLTP